MEGKMTKEGIYQVWHAVEPVDLDDLDFGLVPCFPCGYKHMGNVLARSLDEVFFLTQRSGMGRSTSLGDVVLTPKNQSYYLASSGWTFFEEDVQINLPTFEELDRLFPEDDPFSFTP